MDKQKQIDEMEKDIAVRMAMAKGIAGSMNKGVEGWLGEYLIEKGWVQIPENAVVLDQEEYEELKKGIKTYNYTAMFDAQDAYRWEQGYLQGTKETAEKFAERVKMAFYYEFDELIPSIMADKIDEIAKELMEGKRND